MISASFEEECSILSDQEKIDYLKQYGLNSTGLDQLALSCFDLFTCK